MILFGRFVLISYEELSQVLIEKTKMLSEMWDHEKLNPENLKKYINGEFKLNGYIARHFLAYVLDKTASPGVPSEYFPLIFTHTKILHSARLKKRLSKMDENALMIFTGVELDFDDIHEEIRTDEECTWKLGFISEINDDDEFIAFDDFFGKKSERIIFEI